MDVKGIPGRLPVHTAAHHLIPGNAALKKSQLMPYLQKEGTAQGNIGYDVNNFENGSWLAGNYALRGRNGLPNWGPMGINFIPNTGRDPKEYAFAAIEGTRRQFHDAHENYSSWVLEALDLLAKKLMETKDLWCEEAKNKPSKPEERQFPSIVLRLNTISRRLKCMVENPGITWKRNVYTSPFSEAKIAEKIYGAK